MVTQERLKELLHYCPDTGVFTWIKARRGVSLRRDAGCTMAEGYRYIQIDSKLYRSHRLAFLYMTGKFPEDQIDHINQVRDDNRWKNLRPVTHQENHRNRGIGKGNTSGFVGVCWSKANRKWNAYITIDGKSKSLGFFEVKEGAVSARKAANIKYGFHSNHGGVGYES